MTWVPSIEGMVLVNSAGRLFTGYEIYEFNPPSSRRTVAICVSLEEGVEICRSHNGPPGFALAPDGRGVVCLGCGQDLQHELGLECIATRRPGGDNG